MAQEGDVVRWREARRPAEGIGGAARWHPGAADVRRSRSHGRRLAALQGRVAHCLAACGIYTSALHHRLRSTTLLSSVFSSPCTTRTRSPLNSHDSLCLLLHHDLDDLLLTAPRSKLWHHEAKRVLLLRISRGLHWDICRTAGAVRPRRNCRSYIHWYP